MSIQLVGWALETACGSPSRKSVLVALANCHNHHTGLCCPSLKRLAIETEFSKATVIRALADLEELGLIVKVERQRKNGSDTSNEYLFPLAPVRQGGSHGATPASRTVRPPEPEVEPEVEPLAAAPQNGLTAGDDQRRAGGREPNRGRGGVPAVAKSVQAGAPSTRTRPSKVQCDEIWDALTDIFGPALTRSAETLRGKHVQSLAGAGATREEIFRRAKAWPLHFDSATLTAAALEKHWDTLGRKPLRRQR